MMDIEKTIKVSSKGQITLPKAARNALGSDTERIVVENGQVRLEPVPDLAGNLSQYADKYIAFEEARQQAWEAELFEKHSHR